MSNGYRSRWGSEYGRIFALIFRINSNYWGVRSISPSVKMYFRDKASFLLLPFGCFRSPQSLTELLNLVAISLKIC